MTSTQRTTFALTTEELERFHHDGYAGPFDLYNPDEMKAKLQALTPKLVNTKTAVYHQEGTAAGVTNLASYDRHLDVDFLAEHITRPEIVDRVSSILGPTRFAGEPNCSPSTPATRAPTGTRPTPSAVSTAPGSRRSCGQKTRSSAAH
ncbi:phytanoyl-CoA dioxygenase family protein [Mycobacterium kansasii]|uniref:Phytanoyl-CoA dioxygenase family protein n=1 Tax=Mycobacterium kansasii TaxID=1768 RepID=A0A1V3WFY3_MYCKA|nr:phytanoyl-CoA dioxygenase family protein [Mycobacterium kansasii]